MATCSVVLTFKSVDEILRCYHLNETSIAVLLNDTICLAIFYKMKCGILHEFLSLALLAVKWISYRSLYQ